MTAQSRWAAIGLLCLLAASAAQAQGDGPLISLNVKEMAIQEVLKIAAEKGDFNLAIGPGIRGSVTLFVEDLPVRRLLELAVDMVGAAYREEDDIIRVMTRDDYEDIYGEPFQDLRQNRTFRVQHLPVQDAAAILAPLRSKTGQIVQDVRSNSLVIHDTPYQIRQMDSVIRNLDRPLETQAFSLQRVPPVEMAEKLRGYLPANTKVEPDALGKRVLVTASGSVRGEAEALVALLDQAESQETWTFTLDYADPDSTLQVIQGILTPEISTAWIDRRTRTLAATDFPGKLARIETQIRSLDVPTRQVLIEARIVQVSLDEEIKTGIDWQIIEEDLNDLNVSGSFPILNNRDNGLRIVDGSIEAYDYRVAVEALETFGNTELLSSPRILVADGQSASILVGTEVPYITTDTRIDGGGQETRYEKVTIVSVGVQLDVEVVIHDDGMIEMTVTPEVSSVTAFVQDIPVVETSTTTSRILVKDRRTVILGGLNKTEVRETITAIPGLGRLPILGRLFSSRDSQNVQTELAIFLTPRIVTGLEDVLE